MSPRPVLNFAALLDRLQAWGTEPVVNPRRAPVEPAPVRGRDALTLALGGIVVLCLMALVNWGWLDGETAPYIYADF